MIEIRNTLIKSLVVNSLLVIIKIFFGIIGKSYSLVADGVHSFSDLVTDLVSIIGNKLSLKPEDTKHPYGHGKYEYITSMGIGLFIIILGGSIIFNFSKDNILVPSIYIIGVSALTIIIKYVLAHYLYTKGIIYNNQILLSNSKEGTADVIGSIFVLIANILVHFSNTFNVLKYSDMLASIIVGLFIIKAGFDILKTNISIMLGEQETDEECIENIKKIITKYEQIKKLDNLVVLKYGPYYKIILEISMCSELKLKEAHDIGDLIENSIKENNSKYKYITIHINPY
ncbi:MAG: cation diffusion facilitator family transporter [Bacilli bacterium]